MNRANRAAQFQPFDALKGLSEALRAKEEKHSRVEKREVPEEMQAELAGLLTKIERGMLIEVTFYYNGHYVALQDKLLSINQPYRYIVVGMDKARIYFDDIYAIQIIEM